jgi:hypothetical protein
MLKTASIYNQVIQDLRQLSNTFRLSLEYVSELPDETNEKYLYNPKLKEYIPDCYWLPWDEQLGAWIDSDGSQVKICIKKEAANLNVGDLMLGFTSVITGICLNLQGQVAIHANAVSLSELAIAFVGVSGMGKSTLSAYCTSRGAGFITDDVLVVDNQGLAIPGNPRIKLFPETGEELGLDASEETDYKIFYQPEQLGGKINQNPSHLGIIYLLEESEKDEIYTEKIPQTQAVFELLNHGYDVNVFIPHNPKLLDAYTYLVSTIPVKKLFYPRDFQLLPQVYDFLVKEIHQL